LGSRGEIAGKFGYVVLERDEERSFAPIVKKMNFYKESRRKGNVLHTIK